MTGSQVIVCELLAHGVDTVFGIPGGSVISLYDELDRCEGITHITTCHEQGAAHAADGYARVSGKTGVIITTSGPGASNLVTGIANAFFDSVPLVVFTGNVETSLLGHDSFQEVDIMGITQSIVKHNFSVRKAESLPGVIRQAFHIAGSGRKGPVLVDIPKDIQESEIIYTASEVEADAPKKEIGKEMLKKAASEINKSAKPLIYFGGGAVASGAEEMLVELSERLCAPITYTMMGTGAVPSSYKLNLGMSGMHGKYAASRARTECDVMIAVGVRFSDRATGNTAEYTKGCKVIHIDIDNAEIGKNIDSKIGLTGDAVEILGQLLPLIDQRRAGDWTAQAVGYKAFDVYNPSAEFTPANIIKTVSSAFDEDTVVATDVGQHQIWTVQNYEFEKSGRLLTSGGLGAMGFGLGAAIGGCIAAGGKRTVLFTGDGSFSMSFTEVETAVRHDLPLTIILLNNGVFGMVRQWQKIFCDKRYAYSTVNRKTDYVMLAQALGAIGFRAESLEELSAALREQPDRVKIIDCKIDPDELVLPMIPPGGTFREILF